MFKSSICPLGSAKATHTDAEGSAQSYTDLGREREDNFRVADHPGVDCLVYFRTISKQQYETRSKSPSRNPRVQGTAAIQNYWFGAGGPATTITGSRSLSNKLVAVKRRLLLGAWMADCNRPGAMNARPYSSFSRCHRSRTDRGHSRQGPQGMPRTGGQLQNLAARTEHRRESRP